MNNILKITQTDKNFPEKLKNIPNPPKQLFLEGNIDLLKETSIAIIGSRNATKNGQKLAQKFAQELSLQGLTIISGMAKGIDGMAHRSTLDVRGKTIAVLGCGLNHIYPEENTTLYHKILKNDGLIVSEYPPNTEPAYQQFLQRNRIVSGLSIGVLIIEAGHRSGTSVTARLAHEQDRKVFVLPHEIENKYGVGTNQLIRKGAILVTSTKEIINEYEYLTYKTSNIREEKQKRKFVTKDDKIVYELIEKGFNQIDEISQKTNKPVSKIANIILLLEIEGYVEKTSEGYICI